MEKQVTQNYLLLKVQVSVQVRDLRKSDLDSIKRWLKTEKLDRYELPKDMFGVPGVAFAGLREIQGGYYLFDSMVTNPLVSSATRHTALNAVYTALFKRATQSRGIIGFTVDAGALARAKAAGFRQLPHAVLAYTEE